MIEIIYPDRRAVSIDQIKRWASDDLYNEEGRSCKDYAAIPIELALSIVDYHGGVTLAKGHGYDLPGYSPGDPVPGTVRSKPCPCDTEQDRTWPDPNCQACAGSGLVG